MLARQVPSLPSEGYLYEPKWDGFRSMLYRQDDWVALRSRNNKSLDRALDEAIRAQVISLEARSFVLDCELLALTDSGSLEFRSVGKLGAGSGTRSPTAVLVAFDVLFLEGRDRRDRPLEERKKLLDQIAGASELPLMLSPTTESLDEARSWLERSFGKGVDGLIAKDPASPYQPGVRGWIKFRRSNSADCVVGGMRLSGGELASVLVGLYEPGGALRYVGAVSAFSQQDRRALLPILSRFVISPEADHPWRDGEDRARIESGGRNWIPLAPKLVCELEFGLVERGRFRHPPKLIRWRPDKEADACLVNQLEA